MLGSIADERAVIHRPIVASVLLVAAPARQRALMSSLRVIDEPVCYAVEALDPRVFAATVAGLDRGATLAEVIVIDGESVEEHEREELLRIARFYSQGLSTLLYLSTRVPSETEASSACADDVILRGAHLAADGLRRRVQAIALAPWRRSVALCIDAERRGDRRLRRIRPAARAEGPARSEDRDLLAEAFREGRRAGIALVTDGVERIGRRLIAERVPSFEPLLRAAADIDPQPLASVTAACYLGAIGALDALRAELRRLAEIELARAVPYDPCPARERP